MTQEKALKAFKHLLDIEGYTYREKGEILIVSTNSNVNLEYLNFLPKNINFYNGGYVRMGIDVIPENTVFRNNGNINLDDFRGVSKGVRFENYNFFIYCKTFNPLKIEGISPQKVINCYIKQIHG
jgi:hypothetical protein